MDLLSAPQTDRTLAAIIRDGLPHARRKAHVLIAGAGMAGLVAGHELRRAGHQVTILEARSRIGGRIYTVRDQFSSGLAAEMGAMRIPTAHALTMAYIERFQLKTAPFRSNNDAGYSFIRGVRRRLTESVDGAFDLATHETGLGLSGLLERSLAPLRAKIEAEGAAGWAAVSAAWATASLREFLQRSGWSHGAIDMFGIMARHETLMDTSFLEFFRGSNDVSSPMVRILGGMDRLPAALIGSLEPHVRCGATVREIEQGVGFVRVHYDNAAGRRTITGDYLIVTLPYSVLRHIEVTPDFSAAKQRAIRQIHYDNASKIVFQFRRRFWEDEGIRWGSTVTDLPIRNMVYPEPDHTGARGLLIASYTWAQDAQRWAALSEHERISQALENVSRIHPRASANFEAGASHVWQNDPYAGGAYTVFQPGQHDRLHDAICAPEGRIHFAGEHTSLLHRWVEGAVESALRVALQISLAAQQRESLDLGEQRRSLEPSAAALGGEAFDAARQAVVSGDHSLLATLLSARPEMSRQRVRSVAPPFDGSLAWATLLHCVIAEPTGPGAGDPVAVARLLLDADADPNALCGGGPARPSADLRATPLSLTVARGDWPTGRIIAMIDLLVEGGADVDEGDGRALYAALCGAADARHLLAGARRLRAHGARLDLGFAAALGDTAAVRSWLDAAVLAEDATGRFRPEADRADVGDRDAVLAEALSFACLTGQIEVASFLLDAGTDPSALVSVGGLRRSALHAAAKADDLEVVELLLSRGADARVSDAEWAASPLSWAALAGANRVVDRMYALGLAEPEDLIYFASVDAIAAAVGGRHPDRANTLGAPGVLLRIAALRGRHDVCTRLLSLGADPTLQSPLGQRPADLAAEAGHAALATLLRG